ncbi:Guanylate cyclase soluble subunit beta-2 [Camelus dromedarius]|uniref:Guanylate cyclase soluble subunit beta-2 n=1 Tax=Camelus dromedarius TaxID=9838 RepID=A0A5N4D9H7_CAMDR|nr:Guanylate cyclase soluble subunit beta-2 [Camelus dromedarius]
MSEDGPSENTHMAGALILGSAGVSMEAILKLFGEHFFQFCKASGYDRMLRTLGGDLTEFIENLDALHSYLALSYQEMNAPSFRVEQGADGKMLLHYYSDRRGLCHIVPGIIEAVAKDFFDIDVTMDILDMSQEEERTGKKEHVVFLIEQKSHRQMSRAKPKGLQDSQDIQRDSEALEAAFLRMKERYLSISVYPVKKSGWEVVRSTVLFGKGHLRDTFEPIYPERLWIEEKTFCTAFPFHVVFDESVRGLFSLSNGRVDFEVPTLPVLVATLGGSVPPGFPFCTLKVEESPVPTPATVLGVLQVRQAGMNIQKYVPGLQTPKVRLDEHFSIVHPEVTFNIFSICKFINSQFVLKARREKLPAAWRGQPTLTLRGRSSPLPRSSLLLGAWTERGEAVF